MQPSDLLILILATYLLTDALVNRALPYGIMTRVREWANSELLRCMYCAGFWVGIVVYLMWLVEPQLTYPLAASGGMLLMWRYTGGAHT